VQRNERRTAAALLGELLVALVREEVLQRRQQERAEFPALPMRAAQRVFLQQVKQKRLRQILRVVRRFPLTAKKGVERKPVGAAQSGESLARLVGRSAPGQHHHAPESRRELRGAGR